MEQAEIGDKSNEIKDKYGVIVKVLGYIFGNTQGKMFLFQLPSIGSSSSSRSRSQGPKEE